MEIEFDEAKLYYHKSGNGAEKLLLFHGFGQDHSIFSPLCEALAPYYTCFSFDLFFHGKSTWPESDEPLKKEAWIALMHLFLKKEGIDHFSLLGYSLGGRLALATLEAFPRQTREVFLVAAEGIQTSIWYRLATYPPVLRRFFKSMISHPSRFFFLTKLGRKLNVIHPAIARFAESQMKTPEKRRKVYYSWVVFRELRFIPLHLAKLINRHNISVTLITGRADRIRASATLDGFAKRVRRINVEILDAGHNDILKQLPEKLKEWIHHKPKVNS